MTITEEQRVRILKKLSNYDLGVLQMGLLDQSHGEDWSILESEEVEELINILQFTN